MSLALIQESAKEVRRLAIAGSPLAVGDFRLKKFIAPLEQAGAKVPVFAQVAKAISDVVNGKAADSAANLLSLSTLLNAILYTQGQSGAEAAFQELDAHNLMSSATTRTPARVLKPILQALTTTGSGRFETIRSAVERGVFNDLRLIEPAIGALDDVYPELADLVAEKVLPAYGPGVVPLLKQRFALKGKKSDGRRLAILHQLDAAGTLPLCKTALDDGSPEVKVAAIACLGKYEDCLPLIQEQAASKNKTIRAAALEALAGYERPEINKVFIDMLKGKSLDILAGPMRVTKSAEVMEALFAEGRRVCDLLVKGDGEQLVRFAEILNCLDGRKDTEPFLLSCFEHCEKLLKVKAAKNTYFDGNEIVERLVILLYAGGSKKALEAILSRRDILHAAFDHVVRSALRLWTPEKVYDEFSPLLAAKKGTGEIKSDAVQRLIQATCWDESSRFDPMLYEDTEDPDHAFIKKVKWDPRWVDAAIKANVTTLVCCLAQPGQKAAIDYLLKFGDGKQKSSDPALAVEALARCQYPKVTDYFLELVARRTKGAKHIDYELQFVLEKARHLPKADLPKLDAFAEKLDEKLVDAFLEAIGPLRTTPPPTPEPSE